MQVLIRLLRMLARKQVQLLLTAATLVLVQAVPLATQGTFGLFSASTANSGNAFSTLTVPAPTASSAVTQSAGGVLVSWSAVTTASPDPVKYLVLRRPAGVGSYSLVTASPVATTAYADTPPADGSYNYVVETYVNGFTSGFSNVVTGLSDRTAPTVSITCSPGCSGTQPTPVNVTINAVDAGSGVASITWTLDGTPTTTSGSSAAFAVTGTGVHTITASAIDNAGNVSSTQSVSFTILGVTGWAVCNQNNYVPPLVSDWLRQSSPYIVYANVAGATSVTADVGNVGAAPFASAVTLTAGSFTCAGKSYGYASAQQTAPNTLTAGANTVYVNITATSGSLTAQSDSGHAGNVSVDVVPPTAPGTSYVSGPSSGDITFNWTASVDTGSGVAGYWVEILDSTTSAPPANYPQPIVVGPSTNSYLFTGLVSSRSYWIVILGLDNAGNPSVNFQVPAIAK